MEAKDAYKLINQVTCGPGHAVIDRTAAGHWLKTEVLNLNEPHPEPIFDSINPVGSLVRALLVPYLTAGGNLDTLLDAFLHTSREYHANFSKLERYLDTAQALVPGLIDLVAILKPQNYPAVHHSPTYRAAYKPAYCVVLIKFL